MKWRQSEKGPCDWADAPTSQRMLRISVSTRKGRGNTGVSPQSPQREHGLTDILISDVQPPELWDNTFLCLQPPNPVSGTLSGQSSETSTLLKPVLIRSPPAKYVTGLFFLIVERWSDYSNDYVTFLGEVWGRTHTQTLTRALQRVCTWSVLPKPGILSNPFSSGVGMRFSTKTFSVSRVSDFSNCS